MATKNGFSCQYSELIISSRNRSVVDFKNKCICDVFYFISFYLYLPEWFDIQQEAQKSMMFACPFNCETSVSFK